MHRLIALQSPWGGTERATRPPRIDTVFHNTLILFHPVVEGLPVLQRTAMEDQAFLLEGLQGRGIRRMLIGRNASRGGCLMCPQALTAHEFESNVAPF
jgi:hypothetical protein